MASICRPSVELNGSFSFEASLVAGDNSICLHGCDIAGNLSNEICLTVERCVPPDLVVTLDNLPIFDGETVDFGAVQRVPCRPPCCWVMARPKTLR